MSGLDFVAVDFETANGSHASVCQVGLTRVIGGEVTAEDAWYVIPPTGVETFNMRNVLIHHITPDFVARHGIGWETSLERFEDFAAGQVLIAHNAAFDHAVFDRSTQQVSLAIPPHRWEDTLALSRRSLKLPNHKLDTVARHLGIGEFAHHDACADARACAMIATTIAERTGARTVDDLWPRPGRDPRWDFGVDPAWTGRPSGSRSGSRTRSTADPRSTSSSRSGVTPAAPARHDAFARYSTPGYAAPSGALPTPSSEADPADPLFGEHVVITGDLPGLDRWDVFERIASHGGTPQKGVTRATSVLVVANRASIGSDVDLSRGSAKERKAADYQARGQRIRIIGATEALSLLRS